MKIVLWATETATESVAESAAETVAQSTIGAAAEKAVEIVKSNPLLAAGVAVGAVAIGWGGYALYKKLRS